MLSPSDDPAEVRAAFSSDLDEAGEVWVTGGDGPWRERLTSCSDEDVPEGWIKCVGRSWSHDAAWLALCAGRADARRAIAVMRGDSSERRLVVEGQDAVDSTRSPDGMQLAYQGDRDLWVVDLESGERRRLVESSLSIRPPEWSPDGAWIAFSTGCGDSADLAVICSDGSGIRRVSTTGKLYGPS